MEGENLIPRVLLVGLLAVAELPAYAELLQLDPAASGAVVLNVCFLIELGKRGLFLEGTRHTHFSFVLFVCLLGRLQHVVLIS